MNKKNIIGTIVGTAVAAIVGVLIQNYFNKPISIDQAMMQAASELNKSCPMMVDSETQLDNAIALPDNKFQYNYTLVNYTINEIDLEQLQANIEPGIVNNVRTNPDLKTYRENSVTMVYAYKDKNSEHLLKIEVTPERYK